MGDLLVKGGTVVDGTGAPPRRADVRIRAGRIVEMAPSLRHDGEREIDAGQAYVAPGFIDSHTHFDPTLFWDPQCDPVPQHGVTTVLAGNCSLSMAPVRPEAVDQLQALFCYIEDLPEDVLAGSVPWDWERYPSYMEKVASGRYGVNVAALVGHTPLRLYVMGQEAWERTATDDEQRRIGELLRECLRSGAFGMSTSLGFDEDRQKRPVPSRLADDAELGHLVGILAAEDRFLQFIANPVPKYTSRDVARISDLCRPHGLVHTWISVFYDDQKPDVALGLLDFALEMQRSGARCYPQVSPRGLDIQVNWSGGMSFMTMPNSWHRAIQAPPEEKARLLADPEWRAAAREEWDRVPFTMIRHRLPERIRLVSVTRPEHERWVGSSFADLVADRGGHPSDVMADWLLDNDLQPGVVGTGIANSDPDGVAATLVHPAAVISNSDAGAHLQMMCAVGDTTLLLTRHVRDRGDFTVEEAVHQLSGRQAELFGFHERGVLREGARADLNVFSLDELHWDEAQMTSDLPGGARRLRRAPGGFRYTVVDGVVTQESGALTGALPGVALRGGRPAGAAPSASDR